MTTTIQEVYELTCDISSSQVDAQRVLSPCALLNFMQEAAWKHSCSADYDAERLETESSAWVVLQWHIKILDAPKLWETVAVKTWCPKRKKMQTTRSFAVESNGVECIQANSVWVFFDTEKRAPKKIDDELANHYECNKPMPFPEPRIFKVDGTADEAHKHTTRAYQVMRSDMDTNGHVNNVKYLEWILNDVPDEIYDNNVLSEMKIVYRKECQRGDLLSLQTFVDGNVVTSHIYHSDGHKVTEFSTIWVPKN
ncbi:MAG: thioesterase [Bacillota bacterium]